jgi:TatD DNase family protein
MFVDSHCHLDFDQFDADRDAVLARAREAGVERFLTISTSMKSFPKVLRIAETYPDVYCSVGVHPHDAEKEGEKITGKELIQHLNHPKIVAIGETGLDYYYEYAPRDAQQRNFRRHVRACIASGVPLIVHTREAEDDTIAILKEERKGHEKELRGVLHCFSSNSKMAEYGLEIGFCISVSGMITFKKSDSIRDIIREVPLDHLLVETDAPYLAPIPFRGKVCEPAYVIHTAKCLADLKKIPLKDLAYTTTENFYHLFNRIKRK